LGVGWPQWRQRALWQGVQWGLWQAQRLLLCGYLLVGGLRQGAGAFRG
jgi:hypothetical protein